jgi:predicted RNase H-like HicB family nuclease
VGLRVRGRVFRVVLTPDLKVGGYTVRVLGLPGCITEGDTFAEARRMAKEAIGLWLSVAEPGKFKTGRGLRHRIAARVDT